MQYHILMDAASIDAVTFIPTVAVGFYRSDRTEDFIAFDRALRQRFAALHVIGCSGSGNVFDTIPHIDKDGAHPCIFLVLDPARSAYVLQLLTDTDAIPDLSYPQAMLLSSRGFDVESLVGHLRNNAAKAFFGAIAGGDDASIFYNGEVVEQGCIVWSIDPKVYVLGGVSIHNFEPVGFELTVTRADGSTVLEIEEEPALDLVEEIMGTMTPEGLEAFEYPFFIASEHRQRVPLSSLQNIDRANGTLELFRNVNVGDKLKVAVLLNRKQQEANIRRLTENVPEGGVAFLFICFAFRGHWADMEPIYLMYLAEHLGLPFLGLHISGEIGRLHPNDPSMLQNQTITLVTLTEAP